MSHPAFPGFDDGSLLGFFLAHRESADPDERRRAQLAWSVLCARHVERIRGYVVISLRRRANRHRSDGAPDEALRLAVERLLASAAAFGGTSLREFRSHVRRTAQEAVSDVVARGRTGR